MGVPAFYRWLSMKYPKVIDDVLEERVSSCPSSPTIPLPFDSTLPNPSGLECDNFYIDMNGIIHPCSHPEDSGDGAMPVPKNEDEMHDNVCLYVDRLFRAVRPRRLLYLAIDGVAPRAKMNQQRARRFRSAEEARDRCAIEDEARADLVKAGHDVKSFDDRTKEKRSKVWDSNVITPGTAFMLKLSKRIEEYIIDKVTNDEAWKSVRVVFSDASIPGEGEHKIAAHVRAQRAAYLERKSDENNSSEDDDGVMDPHNLVHILHGLDADLIMLALATHEPHFYILREEVMFGRRGHEDSERRKAESGFADQQRLFDEEAGVSGLALPENRIGGGTTKSLQRLSIPILREYLANEFKYCYGKNVVPFDNSEGYYHMKNNPPPPPPPLGGQQQQWQPPQHITPRSTGFENVIDDIVFLCFFVGNDFLPHLPSLDIRDGALDFLLDTYKRILPALGGYITSSGGRVDLTRVDVILAEVGAIEDMVFGMRNNSEIENKKRQAEFKERKRYLTGGADGNRAPKLGREAVESGLTSTSEGLGMGRAAKALADFGSGDGAGKTTVDNPCEKVATTTTVTVVETTKRPVDPRKRIRTVDENAAAAKLMREMLEQRSRKTEVKGLDEGEKEWIGDNKKEPKTHITDMEKIKVDDDEEKKNDGIGVKMKLDEKELETSMPQTVQNEMTNGIENEKAATEDTASDDTRDKNAKLMLKKKIKGMEKKKLDDFASNVVDNVRLHESGWKDRYYSDKCKAEDVAEHGGKEHLFSSYVVGLCWVMRYYYEGCPSWKWYYPFHYAPFASDLRNIERFEKECTTFEPGDPFLPVEQLLAVFPTDSSHAIPKSSRWLMSDPESPIIDFYPKDVPVDPNGKAMPWLWVVLLPFVDESRLLDAVTSTRKGWTEKDRTANIRGPGDGLVFVHSSHMLAKKVVSGGDIGGRGELVGKLQKHPKSSNSGVSKVLNEFPLDAIDEIVFAVFEEPPACLHQSALNPKALPPPQSLRGIDFRLRRPRLNRGGENISQLAGASRPGGGSMNIGSYERSVASKAGRTVNATGTRPWGAMEPTNKKTDWGGRGGNQPQQLVAGSQNSKPLPVPYRDVRHGTSMRWQAPQPITQNHYAPPQHQKPQAYVQHQHQHQHQHNRRLPPPPPPRPQQQQQFQHQHQHQQQNQIQQQGQGKAIQWSSPPPVPTQNKQGYSFKGHVQKNSNQLGQGQGQPQPHHNQQQLQGHHQQTMHQNSHDGSQSSSRVDSKLISTLRSQLANTLQQNRQNRGS